MVHLRIPGLHEDPLVRNAANAVATGFKVLGHVRNVIDVRVLARKLKVKGALARGTGTQP